MDSHLAGKAVARSPSLGVCLIAGAGIGLVGTACFGLIHAAIIVPIWTRLAGGLPFGLAAGLSMGWALHEILQVFEPRRRIVLAFAFGALLWLTLLPMTLLGVAIRAAGLHQPDGAWEVVAECLAAFASGAMAARFLGGRGRAAIALGTASLALTLTQAGPLSLLTSTRAARLFAALAVVYVVCGAALGIVALVMSPCVPVRHTRGAEG